MSRELDRRDFTQNRITPTREAELNARASAVSDRLPGQHRITVTRLDPVTGNPAGIASESAPSEAGNYIQRALDHVRRIAPALGLAETQPREFLPDPTVSVTSSGAAAVHLQQTYKGIPIFQAAETVRFAPDGAIQETVGSSVTVDQDLTVAPALDVTEAVRIAAAHVAHPHPDEEGAVDAFGEPFAPAGVALNGFVPTIVAAFANKPERPTVLAAGPFGDAIKANLCWFPIGGDLRLTWHVVLMMPDYAEQYRTLIDAGTGEILYCRQLIRSVAARSNVYRTDGGGTRQMTDFPRALGDYGLPIPKGLPGFPVTWVEKDATRGNSTDAHREHGGPTLGTLQNQMVVFNPANAAGTDQCVLNAFYFCCYAHDYAYLLGFREADGNFQQNNFGLGGVASDRVDVCVISGEITGKASMRTAVDGITPIMRLGLVTSTNRHTALDSTMVFHEYMHGISNRLVGGPMDVKALEKPQSAGMNEGWSDCFACVIDRTTVFGAWVVNRPGGLRLYPYTSEFPDHFGHLGTGRYTEAHYIGEIWCATLMEMNRNIGATLGIQLVIDSLKLMPANPSFLDGRDAILAALAHMKAANHLGHNEYIIARNGIWLAFARFGMGPAAKSNGAQLSGIVTDFQPIVETVPELIVESLFGRMVS